MNKAQRKELDKVKDALDRMRDDFSSLQETINSIRDSEIEKHDNMPENLVESERGKQQETIRDLMDSTGDNAEELDSKFGDLIDNLTDVLQS